MVSKAFALSILAALCIAPAAHAAAAATLTCYDNSTGAPNLSLNVYSLMLSEVPGTAGYFSVNTDL